MKDLTNELLKLNGCRISNIKPGALESSIIELFINNNENIEVSLMIYCSWRLSQGTTLLTGWNDIYSSNESNFYIQLMYLKEKTINSININELNDLEILIEGKKLTVFSDLFSHNGQENSENWDLCIPINDICYSSMSDNTILVSTYY
jgi:hypothetical protein